MTQSIHGNRPSRRRRRAQGFTIVELVVAMTIMTVALGAMTTTLATVSRLGQVNSETARALDAARGLIESVRAAPFDEAFARYNADPADDPGGAGTAPGCNFAVQWLNAQVGDADGMAGLISFPMVGNELREDVADASMSMPRDLDGDGLTDALDKSGSYVVLPVHVQVSWQGRTGNRTLDLYTSITSPR